MRARLRTILLVVVSVLAASLVLTALLLIPTAWWASRAAADVRVELQQHHYSAALERVGGLRAGVIACRISAGLPTTMLLRGLPPSAEYVDDLVAGCSVADAAVTLARNPAVRGLAQRLDGVDSVAVLDLDPALVTATSRALRAAVPILRAASPSMQVLAASRLAPDLGALASAVSETRLRDLEALAEIAPALLGVDRPRTFFVALESPAEMRGTGGLVGQYAIVRFSRGRATILDAGSNAALVSPERQNPHLLSGSTTLFGTRNPEWVNGNLSPHGPDAGRSWLRAWRLMHDEQLDGAIALDIVAAARLAAATGSSLQRPDGSAVTGAAGIAEYALNGIYFAFDVDDPSANTLRKEFQTATLTTLLAHAASSLSSVAALWDAIPDSAVEGRILLYFHDATLQERIAASSLSHDVRAGAGAVEVTYNNWSGNKFDYYHALTLQGRCVPGGADLRLDIVNSADPAASYPRYVADRLDDRDEQRPSVYDQFLLLLPEGASLRWLSVDNAISAYQVVQLGGRSVVSLPLVTMAGQQHVVRFGVAGDVRTLRVQGSIPTSVGCG